MAASEEEYDYMSDNFLTHCVEKDVRPGLLQSRTQQRKHDIYKKNVVTNEQNKQRNRPHHVVEVERRQEGLQEAISSTNKGFAMLQKMGYKPGAGIGKQGKGIIEPVPIEIKANRSGLGREQALREIALEKKAMLIRRRERLNKAVDVEDYRFRLSQQAIERAVASDLRKSQRMCEQLDGKRDFTDPVEPWFWPERKHEDDGEEEDEEEKEGEEVEKGEEDDEEEEEIIELEPAEKLEILTMYLRRTYFYCIWCGTEYDDEDDLRKTCPGPTRDDH